MDLLQTKENSETTLEVKLPDGTVFTMSIFMQGHPDEFLSHVQAVLHLIRQKGLEGTRQAVQEAAEGAKECDYCPKSPKAKVYWAPGFEFQKGPG
jgi:hypothetical protein